MLQQIVMDLAICDVVCPFQMVIQCVVIRREANCALLLHFVPPGSPCLPTSSTCVFIIDFGQDKCLVTPEQNRETVTEFSIGSAVLSQLMVVIHRQDTHRPHYTMYQRATPMHCMRAMWPNSLS